MSAAAPTPSDAPLSRSARLLALVRNLIDYGKELAATLHQRAATDPRYPIRSFGITDLAVILVRIKRGLLRASALEARIVQHALRWDAERKPRSQSNQLKPRPARSAVPRARDPDALPELPTEAQIAVWVRRRPVGAVVAVVADICRDLGILPSHPLWRDIQRTLIVHGGGYARLLIEILDRIFPFKPPPWPPATQAVLLRGAHAGTGPP